MLNIVNEYGTISMGKEVVSKIASQAALECYGLVGMASKNKYGIVELLSRSNGSRGIEVNIENGVIEIEISVIVQYGTKVSVVASDIASLVVSLNSKSDAGLVPLVTVVTSPSLLDTTSPLPVTTA